MTEDSNSAQLSKVIQLFAQTQTVNVEIVRAKQAHRHAHQQFRCWSILSDPAPRGGLLRSGTSVFSFRITDRSHEILACCRWQRKREKKLIPCLRENFVPGWKEPYRRRWMNLLGVLGRFRGSPLKYLTEIGSHVLRSWTENSISTGHTRSSCESPLALILTLLCDCAHTVQGLWLTLISH